MAVQQQLQDKKMKFEDHIRRIEQLFKKLRYIYNAICEETANIETKPVEVRNSLICLFLLILESSVFMSVATFRLVCLCGFD